MKRNWQERLQQGWRQLTVGGLIAQGTLMKRWYDRTVNGQKHRYGPYYCWTRKVKGKTKTLALSAVQAQQLRVALATQRQVRRILAMLYAVSEAVLTSTMPGVAKRNRLIRK